jgi:hypothetical protein
MAPELIDPRDEGGEDYAVTPHTDVYSFGMTVLEVQLFFHAGLHEAHFWSLPMFRFLPAVRHSRIAVMTLASFQMYTMVGALVDLPSRR